MKHILTLISMILLAISCSQTLEQEIDSYLAPLVEGNKFSGSILIARGDEILISKGYGMSNWEHQVPNTTNAKFRIASLSKQFTAMAILILQEQNLLSAEDKISKYVKDCPELWKDITIHQLLTHSSGIPNYWSLPSFRGISRNKGSIEETVELVKDLTLKSSPGEKFLYSNSGYTILALIIEEVSQMKFEDFLDINIFEPLNMTNTGSDNNNDILLNRVAGYSLQGSSIKNADYKDISNYIGAAALYSTVEDLYLWDRALYTSEIVSHQSLDLMFAPHISAYGYGYGYGWIVDESKASHKIVRHEGNISGFRSFFARYTDDNAVIIILSNNETNDRQWNIVYNSIVGICQNNFRNE
jgi:CubicO group peptidase (beta-lactamase class C family)